MRVAVVHLLITSFVLASGTVLRGQTVEDFTESSDKLSIMSQFVGTDLKSYEDLSLHVQFASNNSIAYEQTFEENRFLQAVDSSTHCMTKFGSDYIPIGVYEMPGEYLEFPDCYRKFDVGSWNYYQCVPSYEPGLVSTVTIITGDNRFCKERWESLPKPNCEKCFMAACNNRVACVNLSDRATPGSYRSLPNCDTQLDSDCMSLTADATQKSNCMVAAKAIAGTVQKLLAHPGSLYKLWSQDSKRLPAAIQYARAFRDKPGTIQMLSTGLCLDGTNNVLSVKNCAYNGGSNFLLSQGFVRYNNDATDMRLQLVGTNYCLHAKDNNVGAKVILDACDNSKENQKWLYDDKQKLRPSHNMNLCLRAVAGDLSVDDCNSVNDQWSMPSALAGISSSYGGSGGGPYDYSCAAGSPMVNVGGRGGSWIDQLIGTCSDGQKLGPVGGFGGGPIVTPTCQQGFTGGTVTYGGYVEKLSLTCGTKVGYSVMGLASSGSATFACPSGMVISGFGGKSGIYVDSVYFKCTDKVLVSPTYGDNLLDGTNKEFKCADGQPIVNLSGRYGLAIDQINGKCGNGTTLGPLGGTGGGPVTAPDCASGYTGVTVNYKGWADQITFMCGSISGPAIGSNYGGTVASFTCPLGTKVSGFGGNQGPWGSNTGITIVRNFYIMCSPLNLDLSPTFGDSRSDGSNNYFTCPAGKSLTNFSGWYGNLIHQLTGKCGDGTTLGPWGWTGCTSANCYQTATSCSTGFTGATVRYVDAVDQITLLCGTTTGPTIGTNYRTANLYTFTCPPGTKISGFGGNRGQYNGYDTIRSFYIKCS